MKSLTNEKFVWLLSLIFILTLASLWQGLDRNVKASSLSVNSSPPALPASDRTESIISEPLPSDDSELIYVPAGDFVMGSPFMSPNAEADEYPSHTVYLDGFWIHKNEVKNEKYAQCVLEGPCTAPIIAAENFSTHPYNDHFKSNYPVTNVTWEQAATYCEWINGRLPTEAEWEKTARGTQQSIYPWGGFEPHCGFADIAGCEEGPTAIGARPHGQSPYEALDMAGNVREWVHDWYGPDYYHISTYHNPPGPREGENRLARGGGWQDIAADVRTANRFELNPNTAKPDLGFRCVVLNETAPMCQLSYQPLCAPASQGSPSFQSGLPGRNCVPDAGLDPEKIAVQFSCVDASVQQMNVNLRSELTGTEEIKLNNLKYSCETNQAYPDRLFCEGPSANQGKINTVTICRGGCEPNPCPANFYYDEKQETCLPPSGSNGIDCGQGSFFDAGTNTCQPFDPKGGEGGYGICAPGFSMDSNGERCFPDIGNETNQDCPEGTFFDASSERCVAIGADCTLGFYFDPYTAQCQPTTFSNLSCQTGSYFNPLLNCCVPYGNEIGCPNDYTFDTRVKYCVPQPTDGQCPKGYAYVDLEGTCRSTGEGTIFCPPNNYYDAGLAGCQPQISEFGEHGRECPEGSMVDQLTGACTPVHTNLGQEDCPVGYSLDKNSERCMAERNDCPMGTYFDATLEQCLPTTGLLSGCPTGSYYNDWFACCAPSFDFGRLGCPQGLYFDNRLGYCAPPPSENGYCGENFHLDPTTQRCLANSRPSDVIPCPGGLAFDIDLGYCSPSPDENGECGEAFLYHAETGKCMSDDVANLGCPSGYSFDHSLGQCAPGTLGSGSGLSCVSVNVVAPKCTSSSP